MNIIAWYDYHTSGVVEIAVQENQVVVVAHLLEKADLAYKVCSRVDVVLPSHFGLRAIDFPHWLLHRDAILC